MLGEQDNMNIVELIQIKYPNATIGFGGQIQFADHGDGKIVITKWQMGDTPKPTDVELEDALRDPDIQQKYIYMQNKLANQTVYKQLDILDAKSIRALRTNDITKLSEIETEAASLRAKLLPIR